ncbi:hypothetical protein FDP22_23280 (plasmid) [Paroceanicella profunda]|uniref:Alpha/beta hydrolase n=1 Tax=Paroceanicella profunda TaxID=2579971 RepID=A0A5B8G3S8_9RHOB|nr:hypothetical protein [Paroceanicella profunda]QDL94794.1 hypothetical protein FDP22_23280 [Paroceanicella profunda]
MMNLTSQIIYQGEGYLVEALGTLEHDVTIVGFASRGASARYNPVTPADFDRRFLKASLLKWNLPVNFVNFTSNRNCWFMLPEIVEACSALRKRLGGQRLITYGSSMGGFAAINCSTFLDADYFLALSPLYSIFDPFMKSIRDTRFREEREALNDAFDGISKGWHAGRTGLVAYDDRHERDTRHAQEILKQTSGHELKVPFAGHPVGPSLNRAYSLKKILVQSISGPIDVDEVQKVVHSNLENSAGALAADGDGLPEFLNLVRQGQRSVDPSAWVSASQTLVDLAKKESIDEDVLGALCSSFPDNEFWAGAPSKLVQCAWGFCRALEELGDLSRAREFAEERMPEPQRSRFLARASTD